MEGEDWQAVADALNGRMAALRIGQQALATASGVSVATVRQLQHGAQRRRVQNSTLTAVAGALDWAPDHLIRVLLQDQDQDQDHEQEPDAAEQAPPGSGPANVGTDRQILAVLLRIEQRLTDLAERIVPGIGSTGECANDNGPDPAE